MSPLVALLVGYVSGSVPTAYLAGRLLKGIDLRTVGSGNLGATNVFRTLGPAAGLAVFAVDVAKGALPVALLPARIVGDGGAALATDGAALWWALAIGLAAIAGHAKPVFLLWKGGGKGVATAAGVFGAVAPSAVGIALGVFALVLWRSRFVSLASIVAALALPLASVATLGASSPVSLVAAAVAAFVVWSHRANLARLRAGTEPRVGRSKAEGNA